MAARSPIVLDSSPDDSRPLSITPQSARRKSSVAGGSSSPGFASPSSFLRPAVERLTSGSRSQQTPQSASTGFTSAASLLRAAYVADAKESEARTIVDINGDDAIATPTKEIEKVSKRTRGKEQRAIVNSCVPSRSPLQNFANQDYAINKDCRSTTDSQSSSLGRDRGSNERVKYRQPNKSLLEYDVPREARILAHADPLKATKPRSRRSMKPKNTVSHKLSAKRTAAQDDNTETAPAKRPKKKFTKSESIILNSDEPDLETDLTTVAPELAVKPPRKVVKTSAYFPNSKTSANIDNSTEQADSHERPTLVSENESANVLERAPRRRQSWTPVRNTSEQDVHESERLILQQTMDPDLPKTSFVDIISGLAYSNQALNELSEQHITANALIKRRKIELAEPLPLAPAHQAIASKPAAEMPKKAKAVKKKPQTITDLATKVYRPEDSGCAQPPVSDFFAQPVVEEAASHKNASDLSAKTKKARKPRAKKTCDESKRPKVTKASKPKRDKTAVKGLAAKLFSPGAAREAEMSQDFLFGTFSQLAVEDSPSVIRQTQIVLQDSESTAPSYLVASVSRKSCSRACSARDSANLVIGQAYLNHWSQAARDADGDILADTQQCQQLDSRCATSPERQDSYLDGKRQHSVMGRDEPTGSANCAPTTGQVETESIESSRTPIKAREYIDLVTTSPLNDESAADTAVAVKWHRLATDIAATTDARDHPVSDMPAAVSPSNGPVLQLLYSNDPSDSPDRVSFGAKAGMSQVSLIPRPASPSPRRSATRSTHERHALRRLDANASLFTRISPLKSTACTQHQPFSTRDLPKKSRDLDDPQLTSVVSRDTVSPVKRRGRPAGQKSSIDIVPNIPTGKKSVAPAYPASQPTTSAEWVNLDDISDSDTPATPSPPRRRATSTPPTIKPLELETIAVSPSLMMAAPASVAACVNIKATDGDWPEIMADLFPRVTAAVKSTPPSTDMARPTWHEKILLYDPIILEDLTSWLNAQGLRLEVQRPKPKPKTKGRKNKDASADVPEYETVQEELKPWMIQKWCEDKSICCLWKEGLNGARRNRY